MDIWYTLHYGNFNKENAGELNHQLDLGVLFWRHICLCFGDFAQLLRSTLPAQCNAVPRKFKENYAQLLENCPFLKRWSGVPSTCADWDTVSPQMPWGNGAGQRAAEKFDVDGFGCSHCFVSLFLVFRADTISDWWSGQAVLFRQGVQF